MQVEFDSSAHIRNLYDCEEEAVSDSNDGALRAADDLTRPLTFTCSIGSSPRQYTTS
jgi:hypothetical protein